MALIRRDIAYLDGLTRTGCVMNWNYAWKKLSPEEILARASELGILGRISPAWKASAKTFRQMQNARTLLSPTLHPRNCIWRSCFMN